MKKLIFLVTIFLSFLSGCSAELSTDQAAILVGKEFKTMQLTVEQYKDVSFEKEIIEGLNLKLKPYLTEEAYQSLLRNNQGIIASKFAEKNKVNLHINKITFEKFEEMIKDQKKNFHYTIEIRLFSEENISIRWLKRQDKCMS